MKICLTYDYELFLGKNNASYEEILFEPTEKLSRTMLDAGAKGTFFADVCSAIVHKNAGLYEYSDKFESQLADLTSSGHDVQLHLHTSWLYAEKHNSKLQPGPKGYKIHEFGFDKDAENNVYSIICNSKKYLEGVCRKANPDYKCIAYRAGGFCIQPENELIKALYENGIRIDSSVVPRLRALDAVNSFDFSCIPNKINWHINSESGISNDSSETVNTLYEVPVASLRPRLIECLITNKTERSLPPCKPKGEYVKFIDQPASRKALLLRLYHRLFDYRYVSLDTRCYKSVIKDLCYIYRKYGLYNKDAYICLISHPKLADKVRIDNIRYLIESINNESEKFEFVTFSDIYNNLFIKTEDLK